jgi:hypothetical protein
MSLSLSVCPALNSAPGKATVLRPVSVETVRHESSQREKIFPEN